MFSKLLMEELETETNTVFKFIVLTENGVLFSLN